MMNFILTDDLKILLRSGTIYIYSGGIPAGGSLCNALWYKNIYKNMDLSKFETSLYDISDIIDLPFNRIGYQLPYTSAIDFKEFLLISYLLLYLKTDITIPLDEGTLCMRVTTSENVKNESFNIVEFLYPNQRSKYAEGPSSKIAKLILTGKDLWIH